VEGYFLLKTLHILSATILFGTGIGIAFFFWMGGRSGNDHAAHATARITVVADWLFTLSAGILQPVTGLLLIQAAGLDPFARWLVISYVLYATALACWIPVVVLQKRIRDQLSAKLAGEHFDRAHYDHRRRFWFWLGWPAFIALILVFHLMAAKPT
jgi:uncharacterized membrane protein